MMKKTRNPLIASFIASPRKACAILLLASGTWIVPDSLWANIVKPTTTRLDQATIYFHGAELSHSAAISLSKGEQEVIVGNLSPDIDKNSLKIKAPTGVMIASYEYSKNYLVGDQASPRVKQLKDSVDAYQKKIQQVDNDIKINASAITLLYAGIDKAVAKSDRALSFDELVRSIANYRTKATDYENQALTLKDKKSGLEKQQARLEKQLQEEEAKNNRGVGELRMVLVADRSCSGSVQIQYFTQAAAWYPYYDVIVPSASSPVQLMEKAKVSQNTGIDWNKVKITLSSATPTSGKSAPQLDTWFLRFYEPAMPRKYQMAKAMPMLQVNAMAVSVDSAAPEECEVGCAADNTLADRLQVTDNQMNVSYAIDLPYSIPGNGKAQSIDLKKRELQADYQFLAIPKLDEEAYLMAQLKVDDNQQLMSGPANITYEGTFLGETYFDATSTADFPLTLGADSRISVKREKLSDYSSKETVGNAIRQTFTFQTTIRNNKNKAITMTVKDQYPISTQKDIEVELLKDTTKPTTVHNETGLLTWDVTLQPGETKTIRLSYRVKYPKDKKIRF